MRVGINLIFWKPKGAGGIETMLRSFIASMAEILSETPSIELFLLGTSENLRDFVDLEPRITLVPVCKKIDTLQQRLWYEQVQVRRIAKRLQLGLIHTMNYYGPLTLHCPSIVSILDMNYRAVPETFRPITRMGRGLLTELSAANATAIMTISEFSKAEIERFIAPKAPIIPIHLAPSPELLTCMAEWPTDLPADEQYFFSLGSSFVHKNFHGLIASYEQYCIIADRNKIRPARLYIAGVARSGSNLLTEAVAASPNSDRIRLLGPVTSPHLKALYQKAFGFVFPSLYEGFGLPPIEAMAFECPVVCSTAASLPEVVGNAALSGNARVPQEFGNLMFMLHDATTRKTLIQAGNDRVAYFSWSRAARYLLSMYERFGTPEY